MSAAACHRRRVLFITNSPVGPCMSGPSIRYWELACTLSARPDLDVALATAPGVAAQPPGAAPAFRLQAARDEAGLCALAAASDVVVAPASIASLYPALQQIRVPLVLDVTIPLLLEELQRERGQSPAERALYLERLRREMGVQFLAADYILCASEKQRDYWLGVLSALGRVNPHTHAQDPTLRSLIDVVPFGLPSQAPVHTRQVLKGAYPGIGVDDKVLLWGGALYDWLDAPTLVRAMVRLAGSRPDVKLFFLGARHPNPAEAQRRGTRETLALAEEAGLVDHTVFFNDWAPYEERGNYLLEADVGVSLHRDHLETRFSFRTRILDCLWAGLPIVATRGDVWSDEIEAGGLGRVVDPGDVGGLVDAILELVDTPDLRRAYRSRFQQAAAAYRWEVVARPLAAFCTAPRTAPDRQQSKALPGLEVGPARWWRLPGRAWRAWRAGGIGGLLRQVGEYRRWLLNRRGKA